MTHLQTLRPVNLLLRLRSTDAAILFLTISKIFNLTELEKQWLLRYKVRYQCFMGVFLNFNVTKTDLFCLLQWKSVCYSLISISIKKLVYFLELFKRKGLLTIIYRNLVELVSKSSWQVSAIICEDCIILTFLLRSIIMSMNWTFKLLVIMLLGTIWWHTCSIYALVG